MIDLHTPANRWKLPALRTPRHAGWLRHSRAAGYFSGNRPRGVPPRTQSRQDVGITLEEVLGRPNKTLEV